MRRRHRRLLEGLAWRQHDGEDVWRKVGVELHLGHLNHSERLSTQACLKSKQNTSFRIDGEQILLGTNAEPVENLIRHHILISAGAPADFERCPASDHIVSQMLEAQA
jgi:hypothetical protein